MLKLSFFEYALSANVCQNNLLYFDVRLECEHMTLKILNIMISDYLKLIRIKHWTKNLLVFAPLIFSGNLFVLADWKNVLVAFVGFCLFSSSVYVINDLFDLENDKAHEKKKHRPLAAGKITASFAKLIAIILIVLGVLLNFTLLSQNIFFQLTAIEIGYLLLNFFYTIKLKHLVLIDAFSISLGFFLRLLAGAIAASVTLSGWIIVTTIFITLMLAFAKRKSEIANSNSAVSENYHRIVLDSYSASFLDQMIFSSATLTLISYLLYVLEKNSEMLITLPFVLYGVYYLAYTFVYNKGDDPTDLIFKDFKIMTSALLWIVTTISVLYFF